MLSAAKPAKALTDSPWNPRSDPAPGHHQHPIYRAYTPLCKIRSWDWNPGLSLGSTCSQLPPHRPQHSVPVMIPPTMWASTATVSHNPKVQSKAERTADTP